MEKKESRQKYIGTCSFCRGKFTKRTMKKHLGACPERQKHRTSLRTEENGEAKKTKIFLLLIQDVYMPVYWLHVDVPAEATFGDLDFFLRIIWVECCGHLSAFLVGNTRYERDMGIGNRLSAAFLRQGQAYQSMKTPIGTVLRPGLEFKYEYDFGSTTKLKLRVVSEREGWVRDERVRLLARNDPPEILCTCGEQAIFVCPNCKFSDEGWLCKTCAEEHPCNKELFLPVVNSPRVGVCGYVGNVDDLFPEFFIEG